MGGFAMQISSRCVEQQVLAIHSGKPIRLIEPLLDMPRLYVIGQPSFPINPYSSRNKLFGLNFELLRLLYSLREWNLRESFAVPSIGKEITYFVVLNRNLIHFRSREEIGTNLKFYLTRMSLTILLLSMYGRLPLQVIVFGRACSQKGGKYECFQNFIRYTYRKETFREA